MQEKDARFQVGVFGTFFEIVGEIVAFDLCLFDMLFDDLKQCFEISINHRLK